MLLSEILAQSMLGDSVTPLWAKIKAEASVSLFFCRSGAVICVFVCVRVVNVAFPFDVPPGMGSNCNLHGNSPASAEKDPPG